MTAEEVLKNPDLPFNHEHHTPEESTARVAWVVQHQKELDVCGSVIQQITCNLPRHHQGECKP